MNRFNFGDNHSSILNLARKSNATGWCQWRVRARINLGLEGILKGFPHSPSQTDPRDHSALMLFKMVEARMKSARYSSTEMILGSILNRLGELYPEFATND